MISQLRPFSSSSLRFSSRIQFVSEDTFDDETYENQDEMKRKKEYASYPWEIQRRVELKKRGYTDDVLDCTLQGFTNGDRLSLSHLHPGRTISSKKKIQATQEGLTSDYEALSANGKTVRCLLAGGQAFQKDGKEIPSRQLYNWLLALAQSFGTNKITKFWGRKSPQDGPLKAYYDKKSDTWIINVKHKGRDVISWQDVDETFEIKEVAEGDYLEFPDQK